MAANAAANGLGFEVIKQYPGTLQVTRRVKVKVPGKHFPSLSAAEQKDFFWARQSRRRDVTNSHDI